MAGLTSQNALRRPGTSNWATLAQQYASGHEFAGCLLDGLKGEPALTPSYLFDTDEPSWALLTSMLADFAHLYTIANHGWATTAEQIASKVGELLETDLPAAQLAQDLFGSSVMHADAIRQLAVSVGPTRLRAGLTTAEAAASAHRSQMHILLASDRPGCALGAAATIALSWTTLASQTAQLLQKRPSDQSPILIPGLTPDASDAALPPTLAQCLAAVASEIPARRGMLFGISQALALRAAFWSMLAERARSIAKNLA